MILVNDPWPYAIDDTLVDDDFRYNLTQYGLKAAQENRFGLHFFNDETFSKDIMDQYWKYHDSLLDRQQYLIDLFPQHKAFKELELQAHLAVQRGDYEYRTHCDHPKKIITIVSYIDNDSQQGTKLHESENGPVVKTVEWKTGRSMIFASLDDVTWHSYRSGGSTRTAIVAFFVDKGHAVT